MRRRVASVGWPPGGRSSLYRWMAGPAALALTVATAAESGACPIADIWQEPRALYGDEVSFDVSRNGEPVGSHRLRFREGANEVVVESEFSVAVKVWFVTAYRYHYTSTSAWRDGCLVSLQAAVDDNGTRSEVQARAEEGRLKIVGPAGQVVGDAGLIPTDHWHPAVVNAEQVLNTISGKVSNVRILAGERETITVAGEARAARRYVYTGDLRNEVWYDDDGRWVKMRFTTGDGSTIEYTCRVCGGEQADARS